ncbi:MAG: hypothetical protein VW975_10875 [Halieaceae bacterium]
MWVENARSQSDGGEAKVAIVFGVNLTIKGAFAMLDAKFIKVSNASPRYQELQLFYWL